MTLHYAYAAAKWWVRREAAALPVNMRILLNAAIIATLRAESRLLTIARDLLDRRQKVKESA